MDWSTILSWGPTLLGGLGAYLTFKLILWAIGGMFGLLVAANLTASAIKGIPMLLWRGVRPTPPPAPSYYPPPYYYPPQPGQYPPLPNPPPAQFGLSEAPAGPALPPPQSQLPAPSPVRKALMTRRLKWLVFSALAVLFLAWNLPGRKTEAPPPPPEAVAEPATTTDTTPAAAPDPTSDFALRYPGWDDPKVAEPTFARKNADWLGAFIALNVCPPEDNKACAINPIVLPLLDHTFSPKNYWVFLLEWKITNRWTDNRGRPIIKYCTQIYTLPAVDTGGGAYEKIDPWANQPADAVIDADHAPKIAMNYETNWCSLKPGGLN